MMLVDVLVLRMVEISVVVTLPVSKTVLVIGVTFKLQAELRISGLKVAKTSGVVTEASSRAKSARFLLPMVLVLATIEYTT